VGLLDHPTRSSHEDVPGKGGPLGSTRRVQPNGPPYTLMRYDVFKWSHKQFGYVTIYRLGYTFFKIINWNVDEMFYLIFL